MKFRLISIPAALSVMLAAGTLLSGAAAAAPGAAIPPLDRAARVHPKLQYGAQVEPNKIVRVLVQKLNPSLDLHALASRRHGKVAEDFSNFSTSTVDIAQKDVLALAREPGVLFVSPDGALSSSKKPADSASSSASNNNSGRNDNSNDSNKKLVADLKQLASNGAKDVAESTLAPDAAKLLTIYPLDVDAPSAWSKNKSDTPYLTGAGVTVAVLDTGVNPFHPDLADKVYPVFVNPEATGYLDELGHGTHVTGIINGRSAGDQYVGIAPDARVISVKIADDKGAAVESDMLRGLLWVYQHHQQYNIRVVNLSLSAATPQSYKSSPIDAAVERLWQAGITVVASAGNRGATQGATWFAPGNDPFAITVGCLDDAQTVLAADDSVCFFGSRGPTQDGINKPDLVAPGRRIVAPLAGSTVQLAVKYPERISADRAHIRLSGTSMATPIVSGSVALLLQRQPNLSPNQIKWLLTNSARTYRGQPDKAGELNIGAALSALHGKVNEANLNLKLSPMLMLGALGGRLEQTRAYRGNAYWDNAYWDNAYWDNAYWDNAYWDNAYWDNAYWDNAYWDNAGAID